MAHCIAELMDRAEQAEADADRQEARRECADLIMRLWERRSHWPYGQPLAGVAGFLRNLTTSETSYGQMSEQSEAPVDRRSWIGILPRLMRLHEREEQVCRDAALAEINLEEERAWLAEHPEELSDKEREIIERLHKLRERLDSPYYKLDDAYVKNFTSLTSEERTDLVLETLKKIGMERQKLLSLIPRPTNRRSTRNRKTQGTDRQVHNSGRKSSNSKGGRKKLPKTG